MVVESSFQALFILIALNCVNGVNINYVVAMSQLLEQPASFDLFDSFHMLLLLIFSHGFSVRDIYCLKCCAGHGDIAGYLAPSLFLQDHEP